MILIDFIQRVADETIAMRGDTYVYLTSKQEVPQNIIDEAKVLLAKAEKEALAQEAEAQRKQAMLDGADYNGYQVSFTAEDGNGMVQVKSGFELGLTSTTIHFENGTKMPITAEEFPAFALWFVNERNKFFGGINE